MSGAYEHEIRARFDAPLALGEDVADIASLHRMLLRRTHRHYAPRPVPEGLITPMGILRVGAMSTCAPSATY